jgi:alpha-L-rhamnosidase
VSPSRIVLLSLFTFLSASAANPELLRQAWSARWIKAPGAPRSEYGVYHFRRTFTLPAKPSSFVVHVSGDNRYQLFANGKRVAWGPARGDLFHWRYETVDLAAHLNAGQNVLAAVVWNFGSETPMAQVTNETGFLLQGDTAAERIVDTGKEWKAAANPAYAPIPVRMGRDVTGYYVAGPGERVDAAAYPWRWHIAEFDDSKWSAAESIGAAAPRGARDAHSYWMLVPRNIPPMEESPEPALRVRVANGAVAQDKQPFKPYTLAANHKSKLILDQGYYTTGYPELTVTGGRGATISLKYSESLFEPGTWKKGHRDEVAGKELKGNQDIFLPDGGAARTWRPLWWRVWRYIELDIQTGPEPIRIDSLTATFTGYPFVRKARIETSDPAANAELQRMLDVSWKTLRVDAHETFMDCAYYEQLQYVGDTRLEALTTFSLTTDPRLVKNAIEILQHTQTADGLTYARGPSRLPQYIPQFSLYWIAMLHDYWMYQNEPNFVRDMLPASRSILAWFASHQRPNGSLGRLPWWNYVDWVRGWRSGVPPVAADGGSSAIIDLLLLAGYQWGADLERSVGSKGLAAEYDERAATLAGTVRALYWDAGRGLFADTPEKKSYSQHQNAFAILTGLVKGVDAERLAAKLIEDRSLTESTLYFRYYIHSAMLKAGLGDRFMDQLGTWRDALKIGLTTWPEMPEPSRSDAHAWSSHIAFDFFRTMLGVEPAASGFSKVRIQPHLGKLADLSGVMPHPNGEIEVTVKRKSKGVSGRVVLPPGTEGEFVWGMYSTPLKSGINNIEAVER